MQKKTILFVLIIIAFCLPSMADDAVFKTVNGNVEYRVSPDGEWQKAEKGISIPQGSDISTGFKSSSAILVNDSVVMVKALTRMSLDEIVKTNNGPVTGLYLLSGKVQVEVKPSVNTEKTEFKIRSPMSTASVRGTGFVYDCQNLLVGHGRVELKNKYGVNRMVSAGQFAATSLHGDVSKALPVALPSSPLITAEGGEEEIDLAVMSLDAVATQQPGNELSNTALFNLFKSKYSDLITSGTLQKATELSLLENNTASVSEYTDSNSTVTITIH